jgi:heptosyltransferase-3
MSPTSILVVITRRIGDVLLATPLIRSLRRAWPSARIHALVFRGTESVLSANPDLDHVISVPERPNFFEQLRMCGSLLRRYDLAISLLTGDRPTLYTLVAGRCRAGMCAPGRQDAWKRQVFDFKVNFDNLNTHTVSMNLAIAMALRIEPVAEVVVAWSAKDEQLLEEVLPDWNRAPFVVFHPFPKYNYKMWRVDGWATLARWAKQRRLRVFLSSGCDPEEIKYVTALAQHLDEDAVNIAGRLSLGALGRLLSSASLYIGPDTVVTHMAAALGAPTVALYGPSNPVKWGPWPKGFVSDPWVRIGSQRQGNVALLQGPGGCVPCLLEGCNRHVSSFSDCLQQISPDRVIAASENLLAVSSASS